MNGCSLYGALHHIPISSELPAGLASFLVGGSGFPMPDRKRPQRFEVTDYDSSAWIAVAAVALLATVLLFLGAGFIANGHHWLNSHHWLT
jgi:hypothetical protein